jgi:ubiquinone/menaquinone biosynthesis C-methylase UbiE
VPHTVDPTLHTIADHDGKVSKEVNVATQLIEQESGWQLESDSAAAYERFLVPAFFTQMAERLIDLVGLPPNARVLDAACGTGIVARRAARRPEAASVSGLDLNEGMLAVARGAAQSEGVTIDWRQGMVEELPFPRSSFEAVFCQQALGFFPDPGAALRELHRVLAPGGRIGLSVCRPVAHNPVYDALADCLARHAGPAAGAGMRSPFPEWDQTHLRGLVQEAGFQSVRVLIDISPVRFPSPAELLRREAASSPLAGAIAALDDATRTAMLADVAVVLSGHADDDGVAYTIESHVVTATR